MGRRLLLSVLILGAAVSCSSRDDARTTSDPDGRTRVRVARVVDGDTVHVDLEGDDVTIRLIGIDTPESVQPGSPVECYARRASDYTRERLDGATVDLEFDLERTDRFGRTLAYVWIGDELFNGTLVERGFATVTTFPPNVKHVDEFTEAQHEARGAGLGVWGACLGG